MLRLACACAVCVNCPRQRDCFLLERSGIHASCKHLPGHYEQDCSVLAFRLYSMFCAFSWLESTSVLRKSVLHPPTHPHGMCAKYSAHQGRFKDYQFA